MFPVCSVPSSVLLVVVAPLPFVRGCYVLSVSVVQCTVSELCSAVSELLCAVIVLWSAVIVLFAALYSGCTPVLTSLSPPHPHGDL